MGATAQKVRRTDGEMVAIQAVYDEAVRAARAVAEQTRSRARTNYISAAAVVETAEATAQAARKALDVAKVAYDEARSASNAVLDGAYQGAVMARSWSRMAARLAGGEENTRHEHA
ncbi:MAG: hypothetical protein ACYCST_15940 [Acidimicrobiales bacterium]